MWKAVISYSRNHLLFLFVSCFLVVESLRKCVVRSVLYFALRYSGTLFHHGLSGAVVDNLFRLDIFKRCILLHFLHHNVDGIFTHCCFLVQDAWNGPIDYGKEERAVGFDFFWSVFRFSISQKPFPSALCGVVLRGNRAGAKDRVRAFTFIFSQCKSYPKRLTTMTFEEVGVRFSSRYHHIMILASQAGNFGWA